LALSMFAYPLFAWRASEEEETMGTVVTEGEVVAKEKIENQR